MSENPERWRVVDEWLRLNKRQGGSQNEYLFTLRGFYQWAKMRGSLPSDPTDGVEPRPTVASAPRGVAAWEIEQAFADAPAEMRVWLWLALGAGCSVKEIAGITTEDVDRLGGRLRIRKARRGRERKVPLQPEVLEALDAVEPLGDGRLWNVTPEKVSRRMATHLHGRGIQASADDLRDQYGFDTYAESQSAAKTADLMGIEQGRGVVYERDEEERLGADAVRARSPAGNLVRRQGHRGERDYGGRNGASWHRMERAPSQHGDDSGWFASGVVRVGGGGRRPR